MKLLAHALALALCLLLGPTLAQAAPPPWSTPLGSGDEGGELAERAAHERLNARGQERLAAAAAKGKLVVTGACERVERGSDEVPLAWRGKVQSLATIRVSNLSDRDVWLVDLRIAGADDHLGRANLPFLPPHSQAELTLSCDGVHPFSALLGRLEVTASVGPLTSARARTLATTPVRHDQSARTGYQLIASAASKRALASLALPRVSDRDSARLLMQALLLEHPSAKELGAYLGPAGVQAAHGIVDVLLEHPKLGLEDVLVAALAFGSGEDPARDKALARLIVPICAGLTPEQRREWSVDTLFSARGRAWHQAVVAACVIDASDVADLISLLPSAHLNEDYPLRDLAGFIALAPADTFELALPILLGGDPAPGVVDGGLRPLALWRALAWLPEPERLAALEGLIRPRDLEAVLPLLIDTNMSAKQLELFDRVAARIEELPADQRGPALVPMLSRVPAKVEPALLRRLFALAEHDRALLGPLVLGNYAPPYPLLLPEGLATLPYDLDELMALLEGPLDGCAATLVGLRRCLDLIEARPELARAAAFGLDPRFLKAATITLTRDDVSEQQRALLRGYLPYGVYIRPIAARVCERATELILYEADASAHVDFLLEFAPQQACTLAILERGRADGRRMMVMIIIVLAVPVLAGLGVVWTRHRQPRLEDES